MFKLPLRTLANMSTTDDDRVEFEVDRVGSDQYNIMDSQFVQDDRFTNGSFQNDVKFDERSQGQNFRPMRRLVF